MANTAYDYSALIDAVTNAYGKDVWHGITTQDAFYSADFAQKITQVEGVSATYLKNGNVAYYTYADDVVGTAASVGNAVNSNVGSTALSTVVETPASVTVNASTGAVAAESGLKTVAAGSKVTATVGKVAVGVGAVAAGVQLGAVIDGLLYNANPDFWDQNGMSAINPQTWDSICSTQGGKDLFNFVFGIDKDTGETQAYMDQRALAQIAQYLISQNVFSNEETATTDEFEDIPIIHNNAYKFLDVSGVNSITCYYHDWEYNIDRDFTIDTTDMDILCLFVGNTSRLSVNWVMCSQNQPASTYASYTHNNQTVYYRFGGLTGTLYDEVYFSYNDYTLLPAYENYKNELSWTLLYGTHTQGGVEGITPQQGATLPNTITPDMSTADAITALQQLYPDLWQNAITNDVIQPDGTTETVIYVPVPIPDHIGESETGEPQPEGGTDLSQGNSTVSETSPESLIETLLQIITAPDPVQPTKEDTDEPHEYPDTGDGVTPPIVIPSGSASALYSIYNPSQAQINSFGSWLWSNNFVDQILKVFNNPMEAIIGLHKVFATPITSGTGNIKVGYLDSGVSSNLVSNQYTEIDCGTVSLREYFGNVFDYVSTEVYAYLPFVGIVQLNTEDIMRGDINIKYKVDVVTGACLCTINVSRDLAGGQLYTYSGNCAVQYPLSSGSYMGIVTSALGIAGAVVGTVASGGALAPMALGIGASALSGAKTHVQHSGTISGNAGAMGIKKPYLIIRRPQTATANNFDAFNGVAYNEYKKLSTLSGFVKVAYANLENFTETTEEENKEIETLLKGGVLL